MQCGIMCQWRAKARLKLTHLPDSDSCKLERAALSNLLNLAGVAESLTEGRLRKTQLSALPDLRSRVLILAEEGIELPNKSAAIVTQKHCEQLLSVRDWKGWVSSIDIWSPDLSAMPWDVERPRFADTLPQEGAAAWLEFYCDAIFNNVTVGMALDYVTKKQDMWNWLDTFLEDAGPISAYVKAKRAGDDQIAAALADKLELILRVARGIAAVISPLPAIHGSSTEDVDFVFSAPRRRATKESEEVNMSALSQNARTLQQMVRNQPWSDMVKAYKASQATDLIKGPLFWETMNKLKSANLGTSDGERKEAIAHTMKLMPEFRKMRPGATKHMESALCKLLEEDIRGAKDADAGLDRMQVFNALGAILDDIGTDESMRLRQDINQHVASLAQAGRQSALQVALFEGFNKDKHVENLLVALKAMKGQSLTDEQCNHLSDTVAMIWKLAATTLAGEVSSTSLANITALLKYVAHMPEFIATTGRPANHVDNRGPPAVFQAVLDIKLAHQELRNLVENGAALTDIEMAIFKAVSAMDSFTSIKAKLSRDDAGLSGAAETWLRESFKHGDEILDAVSPMLKEHGLRVAEHHVVQLRKQVDELKSILTDEMWHGKKEHTWASLQTLASDTLLKLPGAKIERLSKKLDEATRGSGTWGSDNFHAGHLWVSMGAWRHCGLHAAKLIFGYVFRGDLGVRVSALSLDCSCWSVPHARPLGANSCVLKG